jgi:two-component sensor histidine kinase
MKFHQVGRISERAGNSPNVDVGEEDIVTVCKIISEYMRNSLKFLILGTNGRI